MATTHPGTLGSNSKPASDAGTAGKPPVTSSVKSDRWGKQFNARLLAKCCEALSALDIAKCSVVCKGWKLAQNLEDRLFQSRYAADWEADTADRAEIAPAGDGTAWKIRYKRR